MSAIPTQPPRLTKVEFVDVVPKRRLPVTHLTTPKPPTLSSLCPSPQQRFSFCLEEQTLPCQDLQSCWEIALSSSGPFGKNQEAGQPSTFVLKGLTFYFLDFVCLGLAAFLLICQDIYLHFGPPSHLCPQGVQPGKERLTWHPTKQTS